MSTGALLRIRRFAGRVEAVALADKTSLVRISPNLGVVAVDVALPAPAVAA